MAEGEIEGPQITTAWRSVPTVFAEVVLGHAFVAGVTRIVMGEIAFNEDPGAVMPKYQPVFTLAIPDAAIPSLIISLQEMMARKNDDQ